MIQQPTTLYIIGNGFDLFHGVKSSYSAYREYLKRQHARIRAGQRCVKDFEMVIAIANGDIYNRIKKPDYKTL